MTILVLADGRRIRLTNLYQRYTYEGLMAGLPTPEMNERHCRRALQFARENAWLSRGAPVTLVPPKIEHRGPLNPKSVAHHEKLTGSNVTDPLYFQQLPAVVCTGAFTSDVLKSKPDDDGSHLCIVWFQPDFALPINPHVVRQMQALAWEELAGGWQF